MRGGAEDCRRGGAPDMGRPNPPRGGVQPPIPTPMDARTPTHPEVLPRVGRGRASGEAGGA
ncbi:hypothetical protein M5D96_013656, partial [Drosophila gunungcola]